MTLKLPEVAKACLGFCKDDNPPSPKFQAQATMVPPVELSVKFVALPWQALVAVKSATGLALMVTCVESLPIHPSALAITR